MRKLIVLAILLVCAAATGAQNINFSNTTPAAPSGRANVQWLYDSSSPVNISASYALGIDGIPFCNGFTPTNGQ